MDVLEIWLILAGRDYEAHQMGLDTAKDIIQSHIIEGLHLGWTVERMRRLTGLDVDQWNEIAPNEGQAR